MYVCVCVCVCVWMAAVESTMMEVVCVHVCLDLGEKNATETEGILFPWIGGRGTKNDVYIHTHIKKKCRKLKKCCVTWAPLCKISSLPTGNLPARTEVCVRMFITAGPVIKLGARKTLREETGRRGTRARAEDLKKQNQKRAEIFNFIFMKLKHTCNNVLNSG